MEAEGHENDVEVHDGDVVEAGEVHGNGAEAGRSGGEEEVVVVVARSDDEEEEVVVRSDSVEVEVMGHDVVGSFDE